MKYDYVVIGNSAGGIGCVEAIREVDVEGTIAIISEEEYPIYSRALLPYLLSGEIELEKTYYRPPDFYEKRNIQLISGGKVIKLDFENKKVFFEDGDAIFYKKLLIATGGNPIVPEIVGGEKNGVFTFTNLKDVLNINAKIEAWAVKKSSRSWWWSNRLDGCRGVEEERFRCNSCGASGTSACTGSG
jgi:NAD(P)H-nitrite reductase large subunit